MTYYKIIKNNTFIGVADSNALLRYQTKHRIMVSCDVQDAQYIICKDGLYHAEWMSPENSDKRGTYETADIIEITKDEYDTLYEVEEYEIPAPDEDIYTEPEYHDLIAESTLDFVIDRKIKQMKNACSNAITNGFDIELAEGVIRHFALTTQDQINLITLANLASSGAETDKYPYHADNELCVYFSADEIAAIVHEMQMTIARHTTYFNSLKNYIGQLKNIDDVAAVYWGIPVPAEYQSEVYKDLFGE